MKFLMSKQAKALLRLFVFSFAFVLSCKTTTTEAPKSVGKATKSVESEAETEALKQGEGVFGEESGKRKGDKPYVVQLKETEKRESAQTTHESLFSLHFKEISLDAVISMLSDRGHNFRYVIHPDVGDRKVLGLVLESVTWRDALDIITRLHNLVVTEDHGLIIINTDENIVKSQEADAKRLENQEKMAKMERSRLSEASKSKLLVEGEKKTFTTFKLKYAEPSEVKAYLEKVFNGLESASAASAEGESGGETASGAAPGGKAGRIVFSTFSKASLITAYGTPSDLSDVQKRLGEIDVPQQQIYIEARIVEVSRSHFRSLGVEWGGLMASSGTATLPPPAGASGTYIGGGTNLVTSSTTPAGVTLGNSNAGVSFPATDTTGGSLPAAVSIAMLSAGTTINARLMALEHDGKSKTLSNPKITTINGVKAKIESGREIPYQQSSGGASGSTTVAFKNAVLSLEVTPFVTPNNMISLKILARKDDADFTNPVGGVPSILTRTVTTSVLIMDGGTAVLGGVFENQKQENSKGVPWFSKIPLVGWLFKSNEDLDDEKELLIFISPKIVKGNFS